MLISVISSGQLLCCVWPFVTPWTAARQASLLPLLLSPFSRVWLCATPSLRFSRPEHWSGLPFPSPVRESEKWKVKVKSLSRVRWVKSEWSCSSWPHGLQPTGLLHPSITNSWSLIKLMSIKSVMPFNHLILCHPLLLLPSVFPSIRVFSNESVLIRWPKYWSFSLSISPSNEYSGLMSFRIDWISFRIVWFLSYNYTDRSPTYVYIPLPLEPPNHPTPIPAL